MLIQMMKFRFDNEGIHHSKDQLRQLGHPGHCSGRGSITRRLADMEVDLLDFGRHQHYQQAEGDQVEAHGSPGVVHKGPFVGEASDLLNLGWRNTDYVVLSKGHLDKLRHQ